MLQIRNIRRRAKANRLPPHRHFWGAMDSNNAVLADIMLHNQSKRISRDGDEKKDTERKAEGLDDGEGIHGVRGI